ncbi:MAG TPA: glycosyltransferase [Terriglobia bacterium]|jgi:spore maturation protein CgeB
MRILYVALKYDYGDAARGYSFEHYNFFDFFQKSGHDVIYFDFMDIMKSKGRGNMNRQLVEAVKTRKPELMFCVLFKDGLAQKTVRHISDLPDTTTLNWFCDDHWRFDNYSRFWAPQFNWVVTTARSAVPKYAEVELRNVVKSQWGCNHLLYRKLDLPLQYDVTFVGQPHGNRREMVDALRKSGIDVHCFGYGWEGGRVSQEDMIHIFNQSRININFSNASVKSTAGGFGRIASGLDWAANSLDQVPFGGAIKNAGRGIVNAAQSRNVSAGDQLPAGYAEQIKGRNFEVPGCGGFLLTSKADDLETYYELDREVVCFDGIGGLTEKIKYYLAHEDERAAIAQRGYERTLRDHTYARRFEEIFKRAGLS